MSNIKILHHGAVTGVTGSCHQFISPTFNALIDCGLFQGDESDLDLSDFPFDISEVDALIVTHGHIDHVGRIPWLIAAGFRGPIYCTVPTAKLLPVVLRDALEIHLGRDAGLVEMALGRITEQIVGVEFGEWVYPLIEPSPNPSQREGDERRTAQWEGVERDNGVAAGAAPTEGVVFRFCNAGHILGSAYVEIDDGKQRVVFSGDLGSPGAVFVEPPVSPERADVLVIESTYGDKLHTSRAEREQLLARLTNKALSDGGTLLIPAFSLGRTQELLSMFEALLHEGKLEWSGDEPLPIILDSPLAGELTAKYRALADYWPQALKARRSAGRLPLAFDNLITVEDHREHHKLVEHLARKERPAIVIAASGMCQGGRIVNYLERLLPLESTEVLFVGYQARGTLGSAIQNSKRGGFVWVNDRKVKVRAEVFTVSGFSAHADQSDLVRFIEGMKQPPKEVRLVHGDTRAKQVLADVLRAKLPRMNVIVGAS